MTSAEEGENLIKFSEVKQGLWDSGSLLKGDFPTREKKGNEWKMISTATTGRGFMMDFFFFFVC